MNSSSNNQDIQHVLDNIGESIRDITPPPGLSGRIMQQIDNTDFTAFRKPLHLFSPKIVIPVCALIICIAGIAVIKNKFIGSKYDDYSVLMNNQITIDFVVSAGEANTVSLIGDFNDWDMDSCRLVKQDKGVWKTSLVLAPGRYQYQFVIDGKKYLPDPKAKEYVKDGYGNTNSVIEINKRRIIG